MRHPEVHRAATAMYQSSHAQVHRASQNRYELNNSGIRTENHLHPWKCTTLSGLVYDPNNDYKNYIGIMREKYRFCDSLKWKGETPGMCCKR